jgi:cytochrome c-type biogenesis protein CcmH/NrfF
MDWQEIGKWAAGIVAIIIGGGLVFRFAFVRKSNRSERTVTQNNNRAGRDIIGGDKIDRR